MNEKQQELFNDFKKIVDMRIYAVAEEALEAMRHCKEVDTDTFLLCQNYLEAKLKIK
jgi:hypothetical protein